MWRLRRRRRVKRASSVTKHYLEHKETARELVLARLQHFNAHYGFEWNRVAIRNQRRCWGSCSSLKNLNFNYKILLLPDHLRDYIIARQRQARADASLRQARTAFVDERLTEALQLAEVGLEIQPGHSELSALKSELEARIEKARTVDKAIEQARALLSQQRFDEGLNIIDSALQAAPDRRRDHV